MEKCKSIERVYIADGKYKALWSAYEINVILPDGSKSNPIKVTQGVRGINCKCDASIINNWLYVDETNTMWDQREDETPVATLRNKLSPHYGLPSIILAFFTKNDPLSLVDNSKIKDVLLQQAEQAISNKEIIDKLLKEIEITFDQSHSIPHCCPVCQGKKVVPAGFYLSVNGFGTTSSASPEPCESCGATGMLWSTINQ